MEGYDLIDETVEFNLSVPVKVGMYLTWLRDRLYDPDAQLQYKTDTLTSTFTIPAGVRKP